MDGPGGLAIAIAAFIVVWLTANAALLRFLSPSPQREGVVAGAIVGAGMLAFVAWALVHSDPEAWPIIPLLGLPFAALGIGCGAGAGLVGGAAAAPSRPVAITAIVCGALIFVLAAAFFLPSLLWFGFAPLALILVGVWALVRRARVPVRLV